jgi:hypothetical protein
VLTCLWPCVRRIESGLPLPLQIRCTLVDSPPRLRPSASSASLKSPFRISLTDPLSGARSVLVGTNYCVIHAHLTCARQELGWTPQRSAEDAFLELLAGLLKGTGLDTPPLSPKSGGPFRIREILAGVGKRGP